MRAACKPRGSCRIALIVPVIALFHVSCPHPSGDGSARHAASPPARPPADTGDAEDARRPARKGRRLWAGAKPGCRGKRGRPVTIAFGLNLTRLRRTFLWTTATGTDTLKNLTKYPIYRLLLQNCRVDLLKHTRSITLGTTPLGFASAAPRVVVGLLEGRFDAMRLMTCLKRMMPRKIGRVKAVYVTGKRALEVQAKGESPFCLLAPTPNMLAVARPGYAHLAASGEPHFGKSGLAKSLKKANRQALAWGAFAGSLVGRAGPGMAVSPMGAMANTRWGTYHADVMPGGRWVLKLHITARTPKDAKQLMQLIQMLKRTQPAPPAAMFKKRKQPTPAGPLRNLKAKSSGSDVVVSVSLTEAELRKMFSLTGK